MCHIQRVVLADHFLKEKGGEEIFFPLLESPKFYCISE